MTVAAAERKEWILPSHAAKALCISLGTLRKPAPKLGIRCRQIPGRTGRLYNAHDLEAAKRRMEEAEAAEVAEARGQSEESPRRIGRPRKNETARPRP